MSKYTHDCEGCIPLGEFTGKQYESMEHILDFDLYICGQGGNDPTVIARYGNDGPEYQSGLGFKRLPALQEAEKRAREKGLLK